MVDDIKYCDNCGKHTTYTLEDFEKDGDTTFKVEVCNECEQIIS